MLEEDLLPRRSAATRRDQRVKDAISSGLTTIKDTCTDRNQQLKLLGVFVFVIMGCLKHEMDYLIGRLMLPAASNEQTQQIQITSLLALPIVAGGLFLLGLFWMAGQRGLEHKFTTQRKQLVFMLSSLVRALLLVAPLSIVGARWVMNTNANLNHEQNFRLIYTEIALANLILNPIMIFVWSFVETVKKCDSPKREPHRHTLLNQQQTALNNSSLVQLVRDENFAGSAVHTSDDGFSELSSPVGDSDNRRSARVVRSATMESTTESHVQSPSAANRVWSALMPGNNNAPRTLEADGLGAVAELSNDAEIEIECAQLRDENPAATV